MGKSGKSAPSDAPKSPSKAVSADKNQKDTSKPKKSSGKLVILLLLLGAAFVYKVSNGNPTQQIGRLLQVMWKGMPGREDATKFEQAYSKVGSNDQHSAYDGNVADSFYNLASDFYEYGWGDSFHFGFRRWHEPHRMAILNSQNWVATQLHVKDNDRVLDMGCGVGGPLRGIIRATGANVTGVTINQHQVDRGYEICSKEPAFVRDRCHFYRSDYLKVQGLQPESFDAAFYMESSLHTENRAVTFAEAYRLLKPGGRLVAMEYVLLDGWKPESKYHQELMALHLRGNGCAKTPTIAEDLEFFKKAGFEVKEHFDFMAYGDKLYGSDAFPWWGDLQGLRWDLWPAHPWVRKPQPFILGLLAKIGLVPEDVPKAASLLNDGGDGLSLLGKEGAITPQYYVLAVKPK